MNKRVPKPVPCASCGEPVPHRTGVRVLMQVYDRNVSVWANNIKFTMSKIYCSELCAQIDAANQINEHFNAKG